MFVFLHQRQRKATSALRREVKRERQKERKRQKERERETEAAPAMGLSLRDISNKSSSLLSVKTTECKKSRKFGGILDWIVAESSGF